MPDSDHDFSQRWRQIKSAFSREIAKEERVSKSRLRKQERGIWQRRFWAHLIVDQADFNNHVDYIHWNPVKHGWVKQVADWRYSSFHKYVELGIYSNTWGCSGNFNIDGGE